MRLLKFFIFCGLLGLMKVSAAQGVIPDSTTEYQNKIIEVTMARIKGLHYNPRPMDSVFSERLWTDFINQLDPDHSIFMRSDIKIFEPYKFRLGIQLKAGSSSFFDLVYSRYYKRIKEAEDVFKKIITAPLDFTKKEAFAVNRKVLGFPAGEVQREDVWRQIIKLTVLRRYMQQDTILTGTGKTYAKLSPQLKESSVRFVEKWFTDYFRNAVQGNAENDKFSMYLNTAVSEIDPHTAYVAPKDKSFEAIITKKFFGIGVELAQKGVDLYIKRVVPGGPAYKSGEIKENDVIVAVENAKGELEQISGMQPTQVANMIRGDEGTIVVLRVAQTGEAPRTVKLQRGEVVDTHNKARSAIIEQEGKKIGYLNLPLYYMDPKNDGKGGAGYDVALEVMKLQENQVDGMIIDLRNNGGGALPEVVKMCGTFLPPAPAVTYLRDKDTINGLGFSKNGLVYYDGPLVVLVDESTASAAEIFSAAMQDFHRAIIVGTSSTFGKGTAQTVLNMGKLGDPGKGIPNINYGSMRLTEKKFYRVTGISTQLVGVTPDIVLTDKMLLNAQMEKKYPTALKADTVKVPAFRPLKEAFNYKVVVSKAENRIKTNPYFKRLSDDLSHIREFDRLAQHLDAQSYKKQYLMFKAANDKFKSDRLLADNYRLKFVGAQYQSIRPDFIKVAPRDAKEYSEWMTELSKDGYLKETANIVLDVINNNNNNK